MPAPPRARLGAAGSGWRLSTPSSPCCLRAADHSPAADQDLLRGHRPVAVAVREPDRHARATALARARDVAGEVDGRVADRPTLGALQDRGGEREPGGPAG